MCGKSEAQVIQEFEAKGTDKSTQERLTPFKVFTGNRPSNTLLIEKLTPESVGKLIALYEHKIFVQGVLWNIFSYDQWGVELGKQLANTILNDLTQEENGTHDASTTGLLNKVKA